MGLKHKRTPSAVPSISKMTKEEEGLLFTSNLTFDPPSEEQARLKFNLNPVKTGKIIRNSSLSSHVEFCSFLSSSVEGFIEDLNTIQDERKNEYRKVDKDKPLTGDPLFELKIVVMEIQEKRGKMRGKQEKIRKNLKLRLWQMFKMETASETDTERRVENLRYSGDTVMGPGSSFYFE
jgi:hypothetical protein